ncbi:MAG: 30S ribosomal protein S16 [Actinomycetia bacterium]|nr:30S ribosomal protein S16 [Actinomycetes bacterium]
MATKIRLTRLGKKKQPTYRVVVMDSRKPRDGKYIEQLGIYDPRQDPSVIRIDNERALYWLNTGAQPTERAQKLLEISGAWTQFKVAKGEIHTVGDDAEEPADEAAEVVAVVEESAEESVEESTEETVEATIDTEVIEEEVADDAADSSSDES